MVYMAWCPSLLESLFFVVLLLLLCKRSVDYVYVGLSLGTVTSSYLKLDRVALSLVLLSMLIPGRISKSHGQPGVRMTRSSLNPKSFALDNSFFVSYRLLIP